MTDWRTIFAWREALATCAIEGNQTAKQLLELYKTNLPKFVSECEKLFKEEKQ